MMDSTIGHRRLHRKYQTHNFKNEKTTKHNIDFENSKIVERENNYYKRLFVEIINIQIEHNSINLRTGIEKQYV